jgi:carbamoyl-phosphate synthase large subunit
MNALITSVSRKVPMVQAVRQALLRIVPEGRVYGADSDPRSIARHFVDEFWEIPKLEELTHADLAGFCHARQIRWVIPTRDAELEQFARWRSELAAAGVEVMIGSPETVAACCDKLLFRERLKSLPEVVPTFTVPGPAQGGRWVVKERFGAGTVRILFDLPIEEAVHRSAEFSSPVLQPFIEGIEYSIDLYRSRSGPVWGCVVRSRDLVISGESQVSTVVHNRRLEELCRRAAEMLDLSGHAVFQAIEGPDGPIHLLECNCRFGGASTLSLAAGLNSFGWFFRETSEEGFAPAAYVRGTPGLKLIRHPVDRIVLSIPQGNHEWAAGDLNR